MGVIEIVKNIFDRDPKPHRDERYFTHEGNATPQLLKIAEQVQKVRKTLSFPLIGVFIVGSNRTGEKVNKNSDLDILFLSREYPIPHEGWEDIRRLQQIFNPTYSKVDIDYLRYGLPTWKDKSQYIDVIFSDRVEGVENGVPVFDLESLRWRTFSVDYNTIRQKVTDGS